jgi:hypothetical protein
MAEASVEVNVALAAVLAGKLSLMVKAIIAILLLGHQYIFCSRIVDRLIPRLRALVVGRL